MQVPIAVGALKSTPLLDVQRWRLLSKPVKARYNRPLNTASAGGESLHTRLSTVAPPQVWPLSVEAQTVICRYAPMKAMMCSPLNSTKSMPPEPSSKLSLDVGMVKACMATCADLPAVTAGM